MAVNLPEPRCCSDWKLDQFLDGEMPPAAAAEVEQHLLQSPECRARAEVLRASRREFQEAMPARRVVHAEAVVRSRGNVVRVVFGGVGAVAAMAAGVALLIRGPDETALKGSGVSAVIYANDGVATRVVDDGGEVHPGDAVRFSVRTVEAAFVAVVSEDGNGTVMAYAPVEGDAVAVAGGADVALPGAVKLDAVLGREKITVWSCRRPVAVVDLVADVKGNREHDGCRRSSLVLQKVSP